MRLLCRMNQLSEDLLIGMAPFLWLTAIVLGTVEIDLNIRLIFPVTVMAAVGQICRRLRDRDEETVARLGRELADATRPGHHDHRHLRGVPGGR